MYLVMIGAPGAGKGTIGKIISNELCLKHISMGDILRENIKNETEIGKKIQDVIEKGLLVNDDLIMEVIKERLTKPDVSKGAILDGFPRTEVQAKVLQKHLEDINSTQEVMAFEFVVPEEEIIIRIVNRLNCSNKECGEIYNLKTKQPKQEGICDICGSKLIKREDDTEEVVKNRLKQYHENSKDLLEYYTNTNKLHTINSSNLEIAIDAIKEVLNKKEVN